MSTPSQSHQDAVSSPRPVVAVLGDPGTHGDMVKLLRDSGAEVIVTADPHQLREADGMVVAGPAGSLEAFDELKAKDAERVIGRRVAGGRPVLAAGAALSCLFESVAVNHLQLGSVQVQGMGEWPGESVELFINNRIFGKGEVMVYEKNLAIRINEILDSKSVIQYFKREQL